MSDTPPPDESTIRAWMAGELGGADAERVERYFEEHPPEDTEVIPRDLLCGLRPDAEPPEIAELVRRIGTREDFVPVPRRDEADWREILTQSTVDGVMGCLGHFEVSGVIAAGGMALVLKAWDPDLKRAVALKVLVPELAANATARARFLREARAAAALAHEAIQPIFSVHAEPVPWFAMPYAAGGSLQQALDAGETFSPAALKSLALQVAAALETAHAAGIVHRDIKPGNILLDEDRRRVWVCDFGIARSVEDPALTYGTVVAGTPQFMSPEQAAGLPVDGRSDLFSLGSVLYQCVSGRAPFRGGTSGSVIRSLTETEPPRLRTLNRSVPVWIEHLLGNLMAKDPADRFASAGEVIRALEAENAPRPRRSARRRLRVLLTGLGVAAGLGALQVPPVKHAVNRGLVALNGHPVTVRGRLGTYRHLQDAVAAARDGDVIEIHGDGTVPVRLVQVPEGRRLTLRAAPGARPVLANVNRTAGIFSASPLTVEGLTFHPPEIDRYSPGCLILRGPGNVVRNCVFLASDTPENPRAVNRAHAIHLEEGGELRVEGCRFHLTEGSAIHVEDDRARPATQPTRVRITDSILTGTHALTISRTSGTAGVGVSIARSLVAADCFLADHWNNRLPPLRVEAEACCFAVQHCTLWMPRETPQQTAAQVQWRGRDNVFRRDVPFCSWSGALFLPGPPAQGRERLWWILHQGAEMSRSMDLPFRFPGLEPDPADLAGRLREFAPAAALAALESLANQEPPRRPPAPAGQSAGGSTGSSAGGASG